MTSGVSWLNITAGQGTFRRSHNATQKPALTCGDAPAKILSYPPHRRLRGESGDFFSGAARIAGW